MLKRCVGKFLEGDLERRQNDLPFGGPQRKRRAPFCFSLLVSNVVRQIVYTCFPQVDLFQVLQTDLVPSNDFPFLVLE